MSNKYGCPEEIVESLKRYVEDRVKPGGFLTAVLCNDLFGAAERADKVNGTLLHNICMYIYWEIPDNCWGSKEKVEKWLRREEPR